MRLYFSSAAVVITLFAAIHFAAPPSRGADKDYDWKAAARKEGLNDKEIEQIAQKKVLVASLTFKQVFEPYTGGGLPMFITSDSLLGGFHVLFEESVLRLEMTNARRLAGVLKGIWANLPSADKAFTGKPQVAAGAKRRASIVIATALQLLGEKVELHASLAPIVQAEAARVQAALGQMKPEWLGPPDPGFMALDYTRYKPRGFYVKRPSLQRYFRAVSWLQSIPFRVNNDEELTAILMLGHCVNTGCFDKEPERKQELDNLFDGFDSLLDPGGGWWHLLTAAERTKFLSRFESKPFDLASATEGLAKVRADFKQWASDYGKRPEINDQLAFIPDNPAAAAEISLRVLPAHRTPDGVLFSRTTDPRRFQRDWPDGLELCAVLGSSFARSRLGARGDVKLVEEIERCRPLFSGYGLYGEYLQCLESLLAKPEPDAPPLMSGEAWQIKSCQTALAGWAQLRHTLALQAKQEAHWLCATLLPPGVIEPVPEFFARMARLSERAGPLLREAGAFEADLEGIAPNLRTGLAKHEDLLLGAKVRDVMECLPMEEPTENGEKYDAHRHRMVIKLAEELEQGRMPADPSLVKALRAMSPELDSRWQTFATLCRRLETLAHKQLRGAPFSKEENRFIKDYGSTLAEVMFYDGNSYVHPNDDAPRVVDVFSNPKLGKVLEVAVARPRALYVLYPLKGSEVLCCGVVLPYYEFANGDRLTDAEWKSLLDSPQRPKMPEWSRSIITPDAKWVGRGRHPSR